jgi:ABC-type transporter MlaC component
MKLKIKKRIKLLNNYYSKIKIKQIFIFIFIAQIFFSFLSLQASANNIKKANETIEQMLIEAKQHAIDTINLDPKERTEKVKLLIQKFININFMARATTGAFWKKATSVQKEKYELALLNQIINTIEVHLNTLSTLSYKTISTELRGKKLVYVRGIITDPKKIKPSIKILWKLAANNLKSFVILDLEIENVSLVSSHKAETISILRKNKGSFEALLNQLDKLK